MSRLLPSTDADEMPDYLAHLLNIADVYKQALARIADLGEEKCATCAGTGFEHPRAHEYVRLAQESAQSLLRVATEVRGLVTDAPALLEESPSGILRLAGPEQGATP